MNEETREIALKVLRFFGDSRTEGWDLHAFFEFIAGDNQERRAKVLDVVTLLADRGFLESQGSDFYTITQKGQRAAHQGSVEISEDPAMD